jgi:hypothetical protein
VVSQKKIFGTEIKHQTRNRNRNNSGYKIIYIKNDKTFKQPSIWWKEIGSSTELFKWHIKNIYINTVVWNCCAWF